MKKNNVIFILIIALILVFVIIMTNNNSQEEVMEENTQAEQITINDEELSFEEIEETANVKEFVIESFAQTIDGKPAPRFSVEEIMVNKGDLVRIKITNIAGTHDFKIDEFDVYTPTPLDTEVVVEFIADQAGSFEYYCTMPGHRQNGHWGTLIINE